MMGQEAGRVTLESSYADFERFPGTASPDDPGQTLVASAVIATFPFSAEEIGQP